MNSEELSVFTKSFAVKNTGGAVLVSLYRSDLFSHCLYLATDGFIPNLASSLRLSAYLQFALYLAVNHCSSHRRTLLGVGIIVGVDVNKIIAAFMMFRAGILYRCNCNGYFFSTNIYRETTNTSRQLFMEDGKL